jgi:hypothetical protein
MSAAHPILRLFDALTLACWLYATLPLWAVAIILIHRRIKR